MGREVAASVQRNTWFSKKTAEGRRSLDVDEAQRGQEEGHPARAISQAQPRQETFWNEVTHTNLDWYTI